MPIIDYEKRAEQTEREFFASDVSQANKEAVKRFLNVYDVSPARKNIFLKHIKLLLEKTENIEKDMYEPDTINRIFKELREDKIKVNGKEKKRSSSYYATILNVSLRFVRWLYGDDDNKRPKGFKDIQNLSKKKQKRKLSPKDMVSWEEGEKLIKATNSIELKAIIATQLDGGFRPSEFIDLTYGNCTVKEDFIIVEVEDGKTDSRNVILWRAVPHLLRWLQSHPLKKKNAPLWLQEGGTKGKNIKYGYYAVQKRVDKLFKKIGLDKPTDFYNLRHSAAVISKKDNTPEELAATKFGHSIEYYVGTYGRLSTEDVLNRYSKHYGITPEEKTIEKNIKCSRCDFINEPSAEICEKCGAALSVKKALEVEQEKANEMEKMKQEIIKSITSRFKLKEAVAEG